MLGAFFESFKRAEPVGPDYPPSASAFHADEKTNGPAKTSSPPSDMEKGHDSGSSTHHEYEEAVPQDGSVPVVVSERGAKLVTAESGLKRSLQNRHMQVSCAMLYQYGHYAPWLTFFFVSALTSR